MVNVGVVAYLARELSKEDFGILAISGVLLSFISTAGVGGIGEYIIYYKGQDQERHKFAAFWLNTFLSLGVVALVLIVGRWWSLYYKDERIYYILIILCSTYFFEMLTSIPKAVFRRDIKYEFIVLLTTISGSVESLGKVAFALSGFGVYSLVLPGLIISPFVVIVLFIKIGFKPSTNLHTDLWRQILGYTRGIVGSRLVSRVANDGDSLISGRLLGLEQLGIYNLAFQLSNLFTNNILPIIMDVSYPVLAKSSTDLNKVCDGFLKMVLLISAISFPLLTILIAYAKPVVLILYGPQWHDAILPLQILTLFTLSRSISSPSSSLFNVVNRNDLAFYISILNTVLIIVGVFAGAYLGGLIGVCIGVTLSRIAGGQFQVSKAANVIGLSYGDVFKVIFPFIMTSLVVTALNLLVLSFAAERNFVVAIVGVLASLFLYFAIFRIAFRAHLVKLIGLVGAVYPLVTKPINRIFWLGK